MTSAVTFQPLDLAQRTSLDRAGGGQVADVHAGADVRGEQHVAGDDRLLGDGGPAGQAELGGDDALVHLGALGEPGLLGVLGDDAVERLHVLQRAAHDHRVVDALAVVGEDPHPGGGVVHGAQLGELLALQADGDGADRLHVAVAGLPAEPPDLLDDAGGVGDREGVGHGVHGGVAAAGGGPGAGEHGLGVLAAGLAQVGVQVDEAGQQDPARRPRRPSAPPALEARCRSRRWSRRRSGRPAARRRGSSHRGSGSCSWLLVLLGAVRDWWRVTAGSEPPSSR